jgi:hypothetical protein
MQNLIIKTRHGVYKNRRCFPFFFRLVLTPPHITTNLSVDRQTYYSYISFFNMVQIKPLIAFLLAAATIADVVAQPVAFRGMGAVGGAVR